MLIFTFKILNATASSSASAHDAVITSSQPNIGTVKKQYPVEPFETSKFAPNIEALIIARQSSMLDIVGLLVTNGAIPLPSGSEVVLKDLTNETTGRARQSIILIGVKIAPKAEPVWLYIFKETSDGQELQGVHNAYQMLKKPNIEQNGYRLKFAWHEKLWCVEDSAGKKRFLSYSCRKGTSHRELCKWMVCPQFYS